MNANTRNRLLSAAALAALATALTASRTSLAVPINGQYVEDPLCDTIPNQTLTHELGRVGFFPQNEALDIAVAPAGFTVCVPDDGIANDWIVTIANLTGQSWTDLFFVANNGMNVGNSDGQVIDLASPAVKTDAFRIDGTVTAGMNANLLGESMIADEILQPGEIWRFNVSNFTSPTGAILTPSFTTPGLFAGSASTTQADTASILANPVPEPATIGALGLVASALLMRRRTRD